MLYFYLSIVSGCNEDAMRLNQQSQIAYENMYPGENIVPSYYNFHCIIWLINHSN